MNLMHLQREGGGTVQRLNKNFFFFKNPNQEVEVCQQVKQ